MPAYTAAYAEPPVPQFVRQAVTRMVRISNPLKKRNPRLGFAVGGRTYSVEPGRTQEVPLGSMLLP